MKYPYLTRILLTDPNPHMHCDEYRAGSIPQREVGKMGFVFLGIAYIVLESRGVKRR